MDKSRRQVSKDQKIVLVTKSRQSIRPNQTNRIRKNKYYKRCKITIYSTKDCFYLFPKKTLKGFKYYFEPKDQEALVSINTSNTISNPSNGQEEDDFEIDLNIMDTEQVFITN